jgi:hypothetical protein
LETADESIRTKEEACSDEGEGAIGRSVGYESAPKEEAISNCCKYGEDDSLCHCRDTCEYPSRKEKENIVSNIITARTT